MRGFTLKPDKAIWNTNDNFFSGKDLHDMWLYYDEKFIPWIHHFIYTDKQVYIKKSRGKFKVITNNFSPYCMPFAIGNGYLYFTCDSIEEATNLFIKVCKELLEKNLEVYKVPF